MNSLFNHASDMEEWQLIFTTDETTEKAGAELLATVTTLDTGNTNTFQHYQPFKEMSEAKTFRHLLYSQFLS